MDVSVAGGTVQDLCIWVAIGHLKASCGKTWKTCQKRVGHAKTEQRHYG